MAARRLPPSRTSRRSPSGSATDIRDARNPRWNVVRKTLISAWVRVSVRAWSPGTCRQGARTGAGWAKGVTSTGATFQSRVAGITRPEGGRSGKTTARPAGSVGGASAKPEFAASTAGTAS